MNNVGDHVIGYGFVGALAENREDNVVTDLEVGREEGGVDDLDRRVGGEVLKVGGGDDEEGVVGFVGVGDGAKGGVDGVAGAGQWNKEGLVGE